MLFKQDLNFRRFIYRNFSTKFQFVPRHEPVNNEDIDKLECFLKGHNKLLVLTGAGISTESGIPDYRSETVGLYARSNHKPIQHQEFLKSAKTRQRYWARNFIGWRRFSSTKPNYVHQFIKNMEDNNKTQVVVTQNVDSLHFKAGTKNVIELHGTAFRVICMSCETFYDRFYIQSLLEKLNSEVLQAESDMIRPDGDVQVPQDVVEKFQPPFCESCGGFLKPDIVFFGDNVPKKRAKTIRENVSSSDGILVLGSSLAVFSGYRIVLQAIEEEKDICVINIGPTRADKLIKLKINARCGDILSKVTY